MLQYDPYGISLPCICKEGPEKGAPGPEEPELSPTPEAGFGDRALVCRACQSVITRRELAMEVSGQHRHVFFNPYGVVFELGCFASARNVEPVGPPTDEFTWFPGFAWQVVTCAGCRSQLGWRYTGRKGGFYGLILKALSEKAGRKA